MAAPLVERLSRASVNKWFDPIKDIDWDVPFDLERFYMKEEDISLYGTPTYERLSREDRVRLSLHEVASMAAAGIWFENILTHKFMDYLYNRDPHDPNFRYMLHEAADECRHSIMFGELIRRSGAPFYPVRWWARLSGQFFKEFGSRAAMFIAILAAEEILDFFNRRAANSPQVHPTVRRVCEIHLIEEARHISYAGSYLEEKFPRLSPARRWLVSVDASLSTSVIVSQLVSPDVYSTLGLPGDAARQARRSPHRRSIMRQAAAKLAGRLEELGVIDRRSRWAWRRTGLAP